MPRGGCPAASMESVNIRCENQVREIQNLRGEIQHAIEGHLALRSDSPHPRDPPG